ncbi:hypothetical protein B9479_005831 [Cryptococcus floricola]|uniref:Phosphatidylinositol glycan, class C n=1 Tax=Cryptococcus floricola TaxID=2591691 RepID=A0A5D3ARX8_9TREE|nr:hypothetical protein B9479_005831 [Cryptococcus floricola]
MAPPALAPPISIPARSQPDPGLPKWEKILWRKQPYADNHVPPDFLAELDDIGNATSETVLSSAPLCGTTHNPAYLDNRHFSCSPISPFGWEGDAGIYWMGMFSGRVGGVGCMAERVGTVEASANPLIPPPTPIRTLILPPLLLALLSPVLGTLTSATTSDSIWPLAAGLGFVHLLLSDFRTGEDVRVVRRRERNRKRRGSVGWKEIGEEKSLTSSLSLTSALSASVVLASRLPSNAHVFSLILLSVLFFAGWPVVAKSVREAGRGYSLVLTLSTTTLALSLIPSAPTPFPQSSPVHPAIASLPALIFLLVLFLVNMVGPAMLWYAWRWKVHRGGGWDVAKVR